MIRVPRAEWHDSMLPARRVAVLTTDDEVVVYESADELPEPPPPQPYVPASVSMRQARLALLGAGLLDRVDAALAAIADPVARRAAQIEWEYASSLERSAPLVVQLSAALGLTAEQTDDLFRAAEGL